MPYLVLVRHGQSLWNQENRFTGSVDVPLTAQGAEEARRAAAGLRKIQFQVAYTSTLVRAYDTLGILLQALQQPVPVIRDAALNERSYGDLQGLDKADAARRWGDAQVHVWRRSYAVPPPHGESLEMTAKRVLSFYDRAILGDLRQGKNVLVVAHGNSNRALVMKLDGLTGEQVVGLELPTGLPLIYELSQEGEVRAKHVGAL
ncbi:2,3-diphosphoglycerate-dependent phosphoglycerate mutase [Comamonas sp. JC664]|uniref:2,3-bisphosphoglycerate-dependent phosphoglycerate mutase n=1 Tax=Comamonas sp. JC664 TaxID=2801917 RepID=UPI00174B30E2|nr:2,3-diphosphoglycerate-dependent phosphoglycerate mutase [Comamonas sp. JC664]MBL0695713.1 2,3-diphosphoglycerate-dependent phosphoglycerate mutase [Comamonas sp. JC664]GHG63093.1 2,3-bisphosphoglycerate-dependent phosphoglycerate mutase [Comamonas sp. KCTC 72670]